MVTECQIGQKSLVRIKLRPIFMEKSRLFIRGKDEGNFTVFHWILAGMSKSELENYHLESVSIETKNKFNHKAQIQNFQGWRESLAILGIPCTDILVVLAAVLLLGELHYRENGILLEQVARLLGIEKNVLTSALWKRTYSIRGVKVVRNLGENEWMLAKEGLASSLYIRTVHTIIRRVNSHLVGAADTADPPESSIDFLDYAGQEKEVI